jgi:hypothetical protein
MTQADSVHSTPPTNTSVDTPIERPADSAGALYRPTDISPEELFQAIGRLRQDAQDEIERLLAFLDSTEPDPDQEPSLGALDGRDNQLFSWMGDTTDREADPADSGIADHDALLEQIGTQDWQQGGLA